MLTWKMDEAYSQSVNGEKKIKTFVSGLFNKVSKSGTSKGYPCLSMSVCFLKTRMHDVHQADETLHASSLASAYYCNNIIELIL